MKCETCFTRDFVHADLYCRGCNDKPEPKTKTGVAYLFKKSAFRPVHSVDVEAPEGMEYETSAAELMQQFRIEFIESDSMKLAETIFKEMES